MVSIGKEVTQFTGLCEIPVALTAKERRIIAAATKLRYGSIKGHVNEFGRVAMLQWARSIINAERSSRSGCTFQLAFAVLCRGVEPFTGVTQEVGIDKVSYYRNHEDSAYSMSGDGPDDFCFLASVLAGEDYLGKSIPGSFGIEDAEGVLTDEVLQLSCEFFASPDSSTAQCTWTIIGSLTDWEIKEDGRYWAVLRIKEHVLARVPFWAEELNPSYVS